MADLLVLEDRFAGSFDLGVGEDVPPAGEPERERERLWALAGLRERLERAENQTPLRRIGTPEDIAGTALFLACDASAYVTGQTLHVNGGMAMPG